MNAVQENKISMYFKVDTFFTNHLTAFAANASGLEDHVVNFKNALISLGSFEQMAIIDNSGYALQKQINRDNMRNLALPIVGALKALGASSGNAQLQRHAGISKTDINKGRDTEALYMCENIRDLAQDNAPALIPFGITAAKLVAYTTAVETYRSSILTPGDIRSEASAAGKQVDKVINDMDALLVIIDGFMDAQSLEFPLLYDQYQLNRKIDDSTSGPATPPDVVSTILPGEFKTVMNVPFLPARKFRARNNSNQPLEWSLSMAANSFDTPPTALAPNDSSEKQSISLAPNGDNLVFHNPGTLPAEVEVTITEE